MSIADIMREHVVTASPDELVDEVAGKLADVGVGCVVIVEGSRPVGIVTDRDISVRLDANWADPRALTIDEAMTTDLVTADVDSSVLEVARTMGEAGVRRIPIVDEGDLVGIVTQDDLIVLLSKELHQLAVTIEDESPPTAWGRAY